MSVEQLQNPKPGSPLAPWLKKLDRVWLATGAIFLFLALASLDQALTSAGDTLDSLVYIAPFLAASVLIAAYTKATALDQRIAAVFQGRELQAIAMAALFGALSPFCSCGVIPLIAALLAAGVPLSAVMAFWIASPLMDPEMFVLMFAVFGLEFTLAKTVSAIFMGGLAGYAIYFLRNSTLLADPLRGAAVCGSSTSGGCGPKAKPLLWKVWQDPERRKTFAGASKETGFFLLKWLTLAFLLESLMLAYLPAENVATLLGSDSWWAIPAAVIVGVPAYLNGYAAIPLVSGLMDLGMGQGAALGFMLAGGFTCIPAAIAVYALVKKPVFFLYAGLGLIGSLIAAYSWQLLA